MTLLPRRVAATLAAGALLAACFKVPYTERKVLNPVPDALMVELSRITWAEMLAQAEVQRKGEDDEILQRVKRKIAKAARQPDYDWEAALIVDDTINAWALPGGKIGFYTGILPVLRHEAGMAFVMGHEVGHATARHGGERLAQQVALFGGLLGLDAILKSDTKLTPEQRAVVVGAVGVGVEFGAILPFSRLHESEADIIGTMYMATAGYPPGEAIELWDRMARQTGPSLPAFLSTHPSDAKRQEVIRDWLPKARKRYQRHKIDRDTTEPLWGKGARKRRNAEKEEGGEAPSEDPVAAPRR